MRALHPDEIVAAWEACASARAVDRPVLLLAAIGGVDPADAAALPIGERDARLLALRAQTFGPTIDAAVQCPACREALEFSVEVAKLAETPAPAPEVVALADGEIELRALDSRDLAAAAEQADVAAAIEVLVERSVVAVRRGGETVPAAVLTPDERAVLAEHLGELDARSDIVFDVTCPACAHAWQAAFDPTAYFFTELTTAARKLMQQVAILARAFGWTERDVLSMSAARRRVYLELAEPSEGALP